MATETEVLKLDLDNKQFISGIIEAGNALKTLGEVGSLKELVDQFQSAAKVAAVAAASVYGLKKAIDFTLEAEDIKQVNAQFDAMSASLGLAADVMRTKLAAATRGLVDDTDALKAANQGFVVLGDNARKLPEIFELARKSVSLFGGDIVGRVEQISNALATGNMRSLRSIGISLDSEKALRSYAVALGLTVDMLTESQRKQALMDAALEQMRTKFKGVNEDIRPLTIALQQLKVIIADMGETIALMVNKYAGPYLTKFTEYLKDVAKSASLYLKDKLGDEAAHAERRIGQLTASIKDFDANIAILENREGLLNKILPDSVIEGKIEKLKGLRVAAQVELSALQSDMEKAAATPLETAGPTAAPVSGLGVTPEQRAQMEAERMDLVLKMREIEYGAAQESTDIWVDKERERAAYIETIRAESQARIDALHAAEPGKIKNVAEQELLIRKQTAAKIEQVNKDSSKKNAKTYDELVRSMNAGQAALTVGIVAGFKNMAKGGKDAAKFLKAAFLGMLADRAEAEGQLKIASGIFPPNPPMLAAGAGLLALGGVLRGIAGEGGASIGGGAGGGAAAGGGLGGGGGTTEAPTVQRPDIPASTARGRQVTIAIAGNYFETEQTRRQLVEMIRQETDATAFAYTTISQGAV